MATRKRKPLSIKDKLNILAAVDRNPKRKRIDIANELGLPADRDERHGIQRRNKASSWSPHGELEEALLKWFKQARASGVNFDGSVLKEKALEVADLLGIDDFTASNGWISRFRARHGIAYRQVNGEAASVNLADVANEDDPVACDYDMDEEFLSTGADVPFAEFVAIDNDVPTCEPQSVAEIVAEVVGDDAAEVVANEAPEDGGDNEGLRPPATFAEALAGLEALQSFFRTKNNENADNGGMMRTAVRPVMAR
ncbi:hypothetical protein HPB49_011088 [Dermacentor silvarum]|uniref:Uncharacterized protein n=1 Tax=Dermacentor silvarum TaxID=543639 RepID=A0ACB8DZG6_DERSI|nr:hypothetical protein HPB49_011088 [Dermacentor silvarum]